MIIEKKENKKGRASRIVAMAAVAALGTGVLAAPALAIEDNGLMVEENALLLHGKLAGFGEGGSAQNQISRFEAYSLRTSYSTGRTH